MTKQKVFIVGGGGMVGASAAYAMALQKTTEEIVLIDVNEDLAWGQAADISDSLGLSGGVTVRTGSYNEINTDDIVIITAGANQKPGQTRLELLSINAEIIRGIMREITKDGRKPYVVMVSNPVDVLAYIAVKEFGLAREKVFGTGTTLDTSRLHQIISEKLNINGKDIEAFVLGEHGDSSFSTIKRAKVGGVYLRDLLGYREEDYSDIENEVRKRAYRVIDTKKSTYFAIGYVISRVVKALLQEQKTVLPLSAYLYGEFGIYDVCLSVPCLINKDGVSIMTGFDLTDEERHNLVHSAEVIKNAINSVNS